MSSPLAEPLMGNQIPTFEHVPDGIVGLGDAEDAVFLAEGYQFEPDPWQRDTTLSWMGLKADGRWAATRCGLSVARQDGKTGALEPRILYGMTELAERFLYTAHEIKTAKKMMSRLFFYFDNPSVFPKLYRQVVEIRKANGQEIILLKNGGSIEFAARTRGSGRGYTVDVLIIDEAQELTELHLAALQPTISTSLNRQTIFLGTPPAQGMGVVWTKIHQDAHRGTNPRLAWREWDNGPEVDLDDPQVIAAVNPGFGYRLDLESFEDDRGVMSDATYLRERLGCWGAEQILSKRVIDDLTWRASGDPTLIDAGKEVALSVDVAPDASSTSISGATWTTTEGMPYVDVLETRGGAPDWAVNYIAGVYERQDVRAVVIDPANPHALALVDPLKEKGIAVTLLTVRQVISSTLQFYKAVMGAEMRHMSQISLDLAMAGARKRPIGTAGGWGWGRANDTIDITPVVSATNALWGLRSTEVAKKQKKRTGAACFV